MATLDIVTKDNKLATPNVSLDSNVAQVLAQLDCSDHDCLYFRDMEIPKSMTVSEVLRATSRDREMYGVCLRVYSPGDQWRDRTVGVRLRPGDDRVRNIPYDQETTVAKLKEGITDSDQFRKYLRVWIDEKYYALPDDWKLWELGIPVDKKIVAAQTTKIALVLGDQVIGELAGENLLTQCKDIKAGPLLTLVALKPDEKLHFRLSRSKGVEVLPCFDNQTLYEMRTSPDADVILVSKRKLLPGYGARFDRQNNVLARELHAATKKRPTPQSQVPAVPARVSLPVNRSPSHSEVNPLEIKASQQRDRPKTETHAQAVETKVALSGDHSRSNEQLLSNGPVHQKPSVTVQPTPAQGKAPRHIATTNQPLMMVPRGSKMAETNEAFSRKLLNDRMYAKDITWKVRDENGVDKAVTWSTADDWNGLLWKIGKKFDFVPNEYARIKLFWDGEEVLDSSDRANIVTKRGKKVILERNVVVQFVDGQNNSEGVAHIRRIPGFKDLYTEAFKLFGDQNKWRKYDIQVYSPDGALVSPETTSEKLMSWIRQGKKFTCKSQSSHGKTSGYTFVIPGQSQEVKGDYPPDITVADVIDELSIQWGYEAKSGDIELVSNGVQFSKDDKWQTATNGNSAAKIYMFIPLSVSEIYQMA